MSKKEAAKGKADAVMSHMSRGTTNCCYKEETDVVQSLHKVMLHTKCFEQAALTRKLQVWFIGPENALHVLRAAFVCMGVCLCSGGGGHR